MSQFDEDSMWYVNDLYDQLDDSKYSVVETKPAPRGRLRVKTGREPKALTVKDLLPGQMFRYAGSFSRRNIYMVVNPQSVPGSLPRHEVYYLMLKDGKLYSSLKSEKKKVALVDATLTVDE